VYYETVKSSFWNFLLNPVIYRPMNRQPFSVKSDIEHTNRMMLTSNGGFAGPICQGDTVNNVTGDCWKQSLFGHRALL
jgi:hypothetical protein